MKIWPLLLLLAFSAPAQADEHVILCGGPALRKWENLRVEKDRHDRWWANFVRASTMRMDEIRKAYDNKAEITWIVYKKGYLLRSREDGKPYTTWITEQATKRNAKLIWINTGDQAINAINSCPNRSITSFDFFGHSNKYCFLLDYGSEVMAVSAAWIHERDLGKIRRGAFSKNAHCQSWGCHTGESMSKVWRSRLGTTLVGARGKTDYSALSFGKLPTVSKSWIR
ncbi:hypothetical protein N9165_01130 [Akkermansiaceae bacterium]|nr:hypothetical protein [Akkermansiaceae bacterium]